MYLKESVFKRLILLIFLSSFLVIFPFIIIFVVIRETEKKDSEINLNSNETSNELTTTQSSSFIRSPDPPISDPRTDYVNHRFTVKRVAFRHAQGTAGINYGTNYSTVALLFAPDYQIGTVLPMIDARAHRFNNRTYAANLGIAGRYIPDPNMFCELLGFNAFYDFRQGCKGNYNQIGVGIEVLGRIWDFRANGYFPVGKRKHKTHCFFDDFDGDFFISHRSTEFVSYGFNAEIGALAKDYKNFLLYVAGGPYYFLRKCCNRTLGGEIRIRPQYKDYIALDLRLSYDQVFRTVFQAEIIISLPLYQLDPQNKGPCRITDRQIYQPIERFEIMPLGRRECWKFNF
ncbi:MAG TPA: inverse autotransporter beta domain-containing protein [Rhabdochlamydiaceae bacterium]|nr:inverse autotransporter beta domain-containing protein [Rhabdochlamydiaceae bacterium]